MVVFIINLITNNAAINILKEYFDEHNYAVLSDTPRK